jgi:hypothetical protein
MRRKRHVERGLRLRQGPACCSVLAVKVIDRSEETEDDGTMILRDRERFTNELTLVFASGETAILR